MNGQIPHPESPIPGFQSLLTQGANGVLSVLFAPVCAACGSALDTPLNGCVCRNCWEQIHPVGDFTFDGGSAVRRLVAVGAYDGVYRDIIHALKYQGRRSIAADLAVLMRRDGAELLAGAECVIPVPLHWRREYTRGFNQAREIARRLRRPVLDALVRSRATRPQVELSREQRHENVKNVFALKHRGWPRRQELTGLRVVLIDDVSTTGATLNACAVVLRRAGAAEVSGLIAARTV